MIGQAAYPALPHPVSPGLPWQLCPAPCQWSFQGDVGDAFEVDQGAIQVKDHGLHLDGLLGATYPLVMENHRKTMGKWWFNGF